MPHILPRNPPPWATSLLEIMISILIHATNHTKHTIANVKYILPEYVGIRDEQTARQPGPSPNFDGPGRAAISKSRAGPQSQNHGPGRAGPSEPRAGPRGRPAGFCDTDYSKGTFIFSAITSRIRSKITELLPRFARPAASKVSYHFSSNDSRAKGKKPKASVWLVATLRLGYNFTHILRSLKGRNRRASISLRQVNRL